MDIKQLTAIFAIIGGIIGIVKYFEYYRNNLFKKGLIEGQKLSEFDAIKTDVKDIKECIEKITDSMATMSTISSEVDTLRHETETLRQEIEKLKENRR